jgi:hypothetical protein
VKAATLITRLYPPPVRERWGAEIGHEVAESGVRSWPDALAGAARLWLHPSDWPETPAGQTRRVLAVALFAVTAGTALLLRATMPSATLTADARHPATSLWLVPIALGIVLAAPLPPRRWTALRHLVAVAVRTLAAPALAFAAMVVLARSGLVEHPAGLTRAVLVVCYWATLGFAAVRLCTVIAHAMTTPSVRRLCAALLLIGTGLGLASAQSLLAAGRAPGSLAAAVTLGLLAAATISAGRDLRGGSPR